MEVNACVKVNQFLYENMGNIHTVGPNEALIVSGEENLTGKLLQIFDT